MSDLFESGAEPLFDPAADTDPSLPPVTNYVGVNRNKRLTDEIDVLGDVHLGKKFVTGVPLDRRGEREETVWKDFEASLMATEATSYHIQVGDLFDAFNVPNSVVLRAAEIYRRAAELNRTTNYIIYRGNHDASRVASQASSFDVFAELVSHVPNIDVFTTNAVVGKLAFIPWHPFKTAFGLASELKGAFDHVFGHWDCNSFGGNDDNLIPLAELIGKTRSVVTGHEHSPREFDHAVVGGGDIHVTVVGSMQPYSHGEDDGGDLYVTLTPDEYAFRTAQGEDLSGKNVRFLLKEGESAPDGIEAMSVVTKTITAENEEVAIDVDLGQFDLKELLDMSLEEAGVDRAYAAKVGEQFNSLRAAA